MKPTYEARAPEIVTEPEQVDHLPALIERIAEETRRDAEGRQVELPSGRVVEVRSGAGEEERVTIRSASGEIELDVRLTARGPVLRIRAAELELASPGAVRVDCDRFHVRAEHGIVHETGGDLAQTVAGDATTQVRGALRAEARQVNIEATRGDVQIAANDDVQLLGERIKLNC
ncbi:uncharacterized protein SOCE26_042410 [Sorangium cellulosum]|uniref:Uncharacterized protein n=1 Tax=Sorangium cellulosum TaxID=56 RepID=A0A2L0EU23_SORCE|nr:hypothetical protein [Sorangium cellulosum]AUX42807.1 uncharacterized protein SOCE26_042410 [Sorangium cellulosum]